jgi:Glyoxalase superfamily protein
MSRQLPPRPNLEHLKNQAKDLLDELKQTDPLAQLADALHAVAGAYGFASWPKLKAHVQSTSGDLNRQSPFVGEWIADWSRSKRHPLDTSRQTTLRFDVIGDTVTIVDLQIDADGREQRGENVVEADGIEYLSDPGGFAVRAHWGGPRVLDVDMTKKGHSVGRVTYRVSDDNRTLTVGAVAEPHDRYPASEQLVVFDRATA